tara:strand:+ start:4844 stop:6649 length:1806 start_codon:yes stop_codon:yes gene_type:complete
LTEKLYLVQVIFAYLQIFLLPGVITTYCLNYKSNLFNLAIISFITSLIINNLILTTAIIFNFFSHKLFYIIFFSEILIFILIYPKFLKYFDENIKITKSNFKIFFDNKGSLINIFSFILFGYLIFLIKEILVDEKSNFVQVFIHGDAIEYYSIWAKEYFNGIIPKTAFLRPQLWSANISLVYIFLNNSDLEMFSKFIFNVIPLIMLITIVGFSLTNKNPIYLFTGLLGIIFSLSFTFDQATSGYMEIPLGLGFLIFLYFYKELSEKKHSLKHEVFILTMTTGLVILTKEMGLLIFVFILFYFYKNKNKIKSIKILTYTGLILLLLFCPFYIYQIFEYNLLKENAVVKLLFFDENFHNLAGHDKDFINFNTRIIRALYYMPFYIIIPFILLLFNKSKTRFYFALKVFVSVYIFSWIIFFSNEIRYLFPLILILSMFGYKQLIELLINKNFKIFDNKILYVLISLVLITLIYFLPIKNELIKLNKEEKIRNFKNFYDLDIEIYNFVSNYFEKKEYESKILTNFSEIRLISFEKDREILTNIKIQQLNEKKLVNIFNDKYLIKKYDFLLLYKNCKNINTIDFKTKIKIIKVFSSGESCFYKINK